MTEKELNGIWNYYLSIEQDLSNTSRYIEPDGQENVHSFEFAKLLILACTEIESVFKAICYEIKGEQVRGDIATYKETILCRYPRIVETTVSVTRLGKNIEPFSDWPEHSLSWWSAYQNVKHNRGGHFSDATYINAATAVSALYILIFYLAEITNISFRNHESRYIESDYSDPQLLCLPDKKLPDFET